VPHTKTICGYKDKKNTKVRPYPFGYGQGDSPGIQAPTPERVILKWAKGKKNMLI
jgi:hypothetical protein